jgi:hypothetical protein
MVRLLVIDKHGNEMLRLLLDHTFDDDFQVGDLFFDIDLDEEKHALSPILSENLASGTAIPPSFGMSGIWSRLQ